ncbi:peptide ABC transporter permease oppC fragment 5 [Helicobacter acinonychis]|uniref:ABC-type oligopeptide transport, permease component oppC 5 n=1 Tax=Helicobacter acinonychis (strain Sheeba) TaxID=382638 RepID=Q17W78_HELAH
MATITYVPFLMAASISTLVSLDFLGFGMPIVSASLGELVNQGKNNLTTSPRLI